MIKEAEKEDSAVLAELALGLWPDNTPDGLREEFEMLAENADSACFIKYAGEKPVGFAQCRLRRDYVEGTEISPVGYPEGIFVSEEHRRHGYARELLSRCEVWAKDMGCTEFGSDCELANDGSLRFHIAVGFEEANRIICFRKKI